MTSQLVIFRAFFILFDPKSEKNPVNQQIKNLASVKKKDSFMEILHL